MRIRTLTLNPEPEGEGRRVGQRWDAAVRLQVSVAQRIYESICIRIDERDRTDCPVELSRELLTQNIRDAAAADPPGGSYEDRLAAEQRYGIMDYESFQRAGIHNPRLAQRAYSLSLAERPASSGSSPATGSTGGASSSSSTSSPTYVAAEETLNLLRYNRRRNEISIYFVPAIDAYFGSVTGQALTSQYWSNVSSHREGILVNSGARFDTLAHELGHLLARIGHFSLEEPDGRTEGSAPRENLMHGNGEARIGYQLNDAQVDEIMSQGRSSGYIYTRGSR